MLFASAAPLLGICLFLGSERFLSLDAFTLFKGIETSGLSPLAGFKRGHGVALLDLLSIPPLLE